MKKKGNKQKQSLNEKLHQRIEELETIQKIDEVISSTLNLGEVLKLIIDKGVGLIKARHKNARIYSSIQLIEKSTGKLYIAETKNGFPKNKKELKIQIGKEGITGLVAKNKKTLLIGNVKEKKWQKWYIPILPNIRSELAVPLLSYKENKLIGIFDLESPKINAFDEDDKRLLESLARQVVIAIKNAEQCETSNSVYDIGKKINSSSNIEEVFGLLLEKGMEKTGAHSASARLLNKSKNHLEPIARRGEVHGRSWTPIKFGEGIVGAVAKEMRIIRVPDVTKDVRYLDFNPNTKSEIAVPIFDPDRKLLGVLNFEHSLEDAFYEDDTTFIESLSDHAGIVIQKLRKDQELRSAREQLDAANAMFWLTLVKAIWLHEVKQKSYAIRVAVDIIRNKPEMAKEKLIEIIEEIDSLAEMITIAAPDLPSEDIEEAVSVVDILDSVVSKSCQKRTDIKVIFEKPPVEIPIITANNEWLRIAFENVIKNSLKAMRQDGVLSVKCKKKNGKIEILIGDTGKGIAHEIKEKLFKKPVSGTGGFGMGLLITKNIMLKYRGDISFEELGTQGTIFRLWLPVE